jgi:hypothetical protein
MESLFSFPVELFHPLQHAGFPAHSGLAADSSKNLEVFCHRQVALRRDCSRVREAAFSIGHICPVRHYYLSQPRTRGHHRSTFRQYCS